ncbi:MAG: mannose-1-phosphate guanylyltransferase/mannose-6-phosphate isomerase [Pelovirga sp.]
MILPLILSGGGGSRLWPLSRELQPKQLLSLVGNQTMLQQTISRVRGLQNVHPPLIICNEAHRFMVAEQARLLDVVPEDIILEPCGRNTAPATAIAALYALEKRDDPLLLVLPSDHLIKDVRAFEDAVSVAAEFADRGNLVTFGIPATHPETGYGYIRADENTLNECHPVYRVAEFVEKPDLKTARQYVESGQYYWNSGMFLFRASRFIDQLRSFEPEILACCRRAFVETKKDFDFLRLNTNSFKASPAKSIDYAVMEKTKGAVVVPLQAGWSDIGSWSALYEVQERDENDNVLTGDICTRDTTRSYLHATHRLVAAIGIKDMVIVETADAILVAPISQTQEVKALVEQLKLQKRNESLFHRRVNRPWGFYESIDSGKRFQVKRISVNPGASLSLQKHQHRAEHWVVVSGTAQITCGDKEMLLGENQSTYIPSGQIHRLANPGSAPLEMIEIQSGSYLSEDDIIRYEDNYGR